MLYAEAFYVVTISMNKSPLQQNNNNNIIPVNSMVLTLFRLLTKISH